MTSSCTPWYPCDVTLMSKNGDCQNNNQWEWICRDEYKHFYHIRGLVVRVDCTTLVRCYDFKQWFYEGLRLIPSAVMRVLLSRYTLYTYSSLYNSNVTQALWCIKSSAKNRVIETYLIIYCESSWLYCLHGHEKKILDTRLSPGTSVRAWWRHDIETLSASLALCEGAPTVIGVLPS